MIKKIIYITFCLCFVSTLNATTLVEYNAASAGSGVEPNDLPGDLAWIWIGSDTSMVNNGTYLLQDSTANDDGTTATTDYSYYASPWVPLPSVMKFGATGRYGIQFKVRPLDDMPFLGYSHYANMYVEWADNMFGYNVSIDKYTNDVSGTGSLRYGKNSMYEAVGGIDWSIPHDVFVGYRGDDAPYGKFDFYVDGKLKSTVDCGSMARSITSSELAALQDRVMFGDGASMQPVQPKDLKAEWYYIRITDTVVPTGSWCGDDTHPYPTGDLNADCVVNFTDLAIFAGYWLNDTRP